jgi:hypothetical protein
MSDNVIEVHNLTKRYGQTTVVKGISFSVRTQPLGQEARSECMDGMLLGIRLGFTTACPRTFLEQLATILLPNSVARGRIRRDEMIPMRRIVPIIQYFVIQAGTEQYEGKRISSAVLSTTQPPLQTIASSAVFRFARMWRTADGHRNGHQTHLFRATGYHKSKRRVELRCSIGLHRVSDVRI